MPNRIGPTDSDDEFHLEGAGLEAPLTAPAPAEMIPHAHPGGAYARPSLRFTGMAILAVALAAALILLTLPATAPRTVAPVATGISSAVQSTPAMTATPWLGSPLPAFHDWRVAYLGLDGVLHAVATDGTRDVEGPPLPGLDTAPFLRQSSAQASRDGRFLAYLTPSGQTATYENARTLVVVDLASRQPARVVARVETTQATALFWAPDSAHLACASNALRASGISLIDLRSGAVAAIPRPFGDRNPAIQLAGWIDATHLAVLVFWPATPTAATSGGAVQATFGALDLATGAFRSLTALPAQPLVHLAPDGTRALVQDADNPGMVAAVDTATGQVRQLSTIPQALLGRIVLVAWQPRVGLLAVNTNGPVAPGSDGPRTLLLDLSHDQATLLPVGGQVLGWAPDGGPLVMSAPQMPGGDATAPKLVAVSAVERPGSYAYLALAQATRAFLGFIRTA